NEVAFAGAVELAGTKKLFEHLEHSARNRVDSRAFLAARLMDVFIGDWDRHQDQWRWARFDSGEVHWWRPIPRDRDQAFARLDGVLIWLTGYYWPQVIGFGDDYPSIWRLTLTGQVADRRLLVDLEKPVWDSVAKALQARLTDSVIDAAVRRLPPEYFRPNGPALTRALRRRGRRAVGTLTGPHNAVRKRSWDRPLREGTGDVRGPPPLRRAAARYVDARAAARLGLALDAPDLGRLCAGHRPVRGSGRRRDRVRLPAPAVQLPRESARGVCDGRP